MTEAPDAPAPDEPPVPIDWRRPAGPFETGAAVRRQPLVVVRATTRFEIGLVLSRTVDIVRSRWLELLILTVVLGWAPSHLFWLVAHRSYPSWGHALTPSGLGTAIRIGQDLTYEVAQASIMATALRGAEAPLFSGIARVLQALPALFPAWLVSHFDIAVRLLTDWTGFLATGSLDQRVAGVLTLSGLETLLVLVATVSVGVFYPIVLDEGRGPFGAVGRAWRLMNGERWRFAALFFLYVAAELLISLPSPIATIVRADHGAAQAVGWVTGGLFDAIASLWSVVVAASFIELRSAKEGLPHDQTAQAFA